jgi:hypothetical protein
LQDGADTKKALSSSEDESALGWWEIGVPGVVTHLFGNPAVHFQDPWLCVTRLLWLCPFGERLSLSPLTGVADFYQMLSAKATFFFIRDIFYHQPLLFQGMGRVRMRHSGFV